MSVYTSLDKAAHRLIKKFGMSVTVKVPVAGAPVIPLEVWKPTANTFLGNKTVFMAFLPEETINFYTQFRSTLSKEDYQVGYEYALMANEGFEPKLDMIVLRSGVEQRIKYVLSYAPAGTAILYVVGLKV